MKNTEQNVVTVIFRTPSEAYEVLSSLKRDLNTNDFVVSQVALIKKENGVFTVKESYDNAVKTSDNTRIGGVVGLFVGILAGPLGMLLGGTTGALVGSLIDTEDASSEMSLIEQMGAKLEEGDTALVILADETRESGLDSYFRGYSVEILRRDAKEVEQEVRDAEALQKELAKEAKAKTRAAKKAAFKEKFAKKKSK